MISRRPFQNSSDREQIRIRSCARHLEIAAYHGSQRFRESESRNESSVSYELFKTNMTANSSVKNTSWFHELLLNLLNFKMNSYMKTRWKLFISSSKNEPKMVEMKINAKWKRVMFSSKISKKNYFAQSCLKRALDLPYLCTWEVRRYFYAQSERIPRRHLTNEIISRIFDKTKSVFSQARLASRTFRNLGDVKKRRVRGWIPTMDLRAWAFR